MYSHALGRRVPSRSRHRLLALLAASAFVVASCGDASPTPSTVRESASPGTGAPASDAASAPASASASASAGASAGPVAEAPRAEIAIRLVTVGDPGNPSVGVVTTFVAGQGSFVQMPTGTGVYADCSEAPAAPPDCITMGSVADTYQIGELEVTVEQYVAFLNTVDPAGTNSRGLYHDHMNAQVWPKYGPIAFDGSAAAGAHYAVAYPEWADKPFGFANFLRAARFVNSLVNGDILDTTQSQDDGVAITTVRVRLGRDTESGMYDMTNPATERTRDTGFVIPSNDEWAKAAYYDPKGGGTHSYWLYPTGPSDAPSASQLDPATGDVVNAATQPLSTYSPQGPMAPAGTYPVWCPGGLDIKTCEGTSPAGLPPGIDARAWQGSVSTVGQTATRSPWGTLDQGGNVVEWQDTIVPTFQGYTFDRVWRRMHGGVANAPAYQLLINAIGFQPQDQVVMDEVYPWFGFRVGMIGQN